MKSSIFSAVLVGVYASTAFSCGIPHEARSDDGVALAKRAPMCSNPDPIGDPDVVVDMEQALQATGDQTLEIGGVNGCDAVFIWTADDPPRLLASHVPPGWETNAGEALAALKGTGSSSQTILIYAPDQASANTMASALTANGFTLAPTIEIYSEVADGSYYVFEAQADVVGGIALSVEDPDA